MLSQLSVKNYALIRELEVDFSDGFTVITGETGSGKSVLLGALGLILGNRADNAVLLDKSRKCIVEAAFNLKDCSIEPFFLDRNLDYDDNTIIRREINPAGKSRAFVNDTPVNLNLLKDVSERLVDIHAQGELYQLGDAGFQIQVIDSFAGIADQVNDYWSAFEVWSEKKRLLEQLKQTELKAGSEKDYLHFVLKELDESRLMAGEQLVLEQELELLTHAGEIKRVLFEALNSLENDDHSILNQVSVLAGNFAKLSQIGNRFSDLAGRTDSVLIELKDISKEIQKLEESISHQPGRMEEVKDRLDVIYRLEAKHKVNSIEELLEQKISLIQKVEEIDSLQGRIYDLENEIQTNHKDLIAQAEKISKARKMAFQPFKAEIVKTLISLGMPDARFEIQHITLSDINRNGLDRIIFQFNANKGDAIQDMA
ncbi:MAG: AAA family ATPase, partial [Bacteroidales bacterium]